MSRSRLVLFLVLITLFVALLIFNDIRWNFTKNDQTHITIITEAKYGDEWERVIAGAKAAASEYGVELKLLAPDYEKAFSDQINLLEASRTGGTDGVILAPIDAYELSASIVNTSDAGIPVLSIITPVSHLGLIEYIGTDHYEAGQQLGAMIVKEYGNVGDMAIVTTDDEDPNLIIREAGLRDYLHEHSQIQIAQTYKSVKDIHSARKVTEAILVASKFEVIVGLDLTTTTGIAEAIAGRQSSVQAYGFDMSERIATYIDEDVLGGSIAQNYFNMGYLSVKEMVRFIEDREILETVTVEPYSVTAENIYGKEAQMILFPIK